MYIGVRILWLFILPKISIIYNLSLSICSSWIGLPSCLSRCLRGKIVPKKNLLKSKANSFDKFRQVGYNSRINRIFANISTDLGPVSFYRIAERCDYWIQVTRSAFCRFGQYFVYWQQVTFSSACFCFFSDSVVPTVPRQIQYRNNYAANGKGYFR